MKRSIDCRQHVVCSYENRRSQAKTREILSSTSEEYFLTAFEST